MKENVYKDSIKYDKKIKTVCAPLLNCFNINVFTYFYIGADGHFLTLCNNSELIEHYYTQDLFLKNPYLVNPNLLSTGATLVSSTKDPEFLPQEEEFFLHFSIYNPLLILEKNEEGVEGFFFALDEDRKIDYLQYFDQLKKFTKFFTEESKGIIRKSKEQGHNLVKLKGDLFYSRESSLPLSHINSSTTQFLQQIYPLTRREYQCLELYKQGHSAQATASILGLSQRTIEHYFESIKDKLNCYHKRDLLSR